MSASRHRGGRLACFKESEASVDHVCTSVLEYSVTLEAFAQDMCEPVPGANTNNKYTDRQCDRELLVAPQQPAKHDGHQSAVDERRSIDPASSRNLLFWGNRHR